MFGRATIRLGIGPHSSFSLFCLPVSQHHCCCASFLLVQWKYSLLLDVDVQLKFYLLVTGLVTSQEVVQLKKVQFEIQ